MVIKNSLTLILLALLIACLGFPPDNLSAAQKGPNYNEMFQRKSASADIFIDTAEHMALNRESGEHLGLIEKAKDARKAAHSERENEKMPEAISSLEASINFAVHAITMLTKGQSIRDSAIVEREKSIKEKRQNIALATFERKMQETETFIAVAQRIASKTDHTEVRSLINVSEEKKNEASAAVKNSEVEKGIEFLLESYSLAIQAVRSMREGQVIIRKPVFDSIKEEFIYEKESNDSYRMMVLRPLKPIPLTLTGATEDADLLKKSAEDAADKGNIADALETIKKSTEIYMKILEQSK